MSAHEPTRTTEGLFQNRYAEVTWSCIIFGLLVGVIMNAAITYAGLKIGFTLPGSSIAAVLGFGVLRGLLRRGSILETNIAQTIASAVNTSNSGIIFTVPVLLLLGYELNASRADFWLITLAGVAGALLGTAFIIPLRKQMIDIERLRFPTGTAVASILKSPGAGAAKAVVLCVGLLVGMIIFLPTQLELLGMSGLAELPVIGAAHGGVVGNDSVDVGQLVGLPAQFSLIFAIAPFALGAGFITGRPGLYVVAGGILAFLVLNPIVYWLGWLPAHIEPQEVAGFARGAYNRPLGIGMLLGGALLGILFSLPSIKEALKSIAFAGKTAGGREELGLGTLSIAVVAAFVILYLAADYMDSQPFNRKCPVTQTTLADDTNPPTADFAGYNVAFSSGEAADTWSGWNDTQRQEALATLSARPGWLSGINRHARAAVIAAVGGIWIWLAGIIIAQCTGMTDWSPISGLALLTVVLVMMLAGTGAVIGAVLLGCALCVATTLAADMMSDLKTGYLVGAQPKRQQTVELLVVGIGPAISMLTVVLIAQANLKQGGPAMGPGSATSAPQAQALQAVITGVQGGQMPYALYGLGAAIGALLGLGAFPGLGVMVGLSMYLPFQYIATYGIGCLANILIGSIKGRDWAENWGVPFSAGLIVGESVLALFLNMYILSTGG